MSMNGVRMPAVNSIPSAPVLRTKSESIYIEHPSTHSSRCGTSSSDMPVRVPAVNIVAPLVYVFLVHLSDSPAVSVSHVTLSDKSATKKLHHLWRNHVGRSLAMARYGSFVIWFCCYAYGFSSKTLTQGHRLTGNGAFQYKTVVPC